MYVGTYVRTYVCMYVRIVTFPWQSLRSNWHRGLQFFASKTNRWWARNVRLWVGDEQTGHETRSFCLEIDVQYWLCSFEIMTQLTCLLTIFPANLSSFPRISCFTQLYLTQTGLCTEYEIISINTWLVLWNPMRHESRLNQRWADDQMALARFGSLGSLGKSWESPALSTICLSFLGDVSRYVPESQVRGDFDTIGQQMHACCSRCGHKPQFCKYLLM